jgi:hypothetical protein
VWLIVGATDGNELDDFGMLHGLLHRPEDFTPRPVFAALQNTATLFSDTQPDSTIQIRASGSSDRSPLGYGFRSAKGKAIIAYWLPVLSKAGDHSPPDRVSLQITNSSIQNPVLVDVTSGEMTALSWKSGSTDMLERVPFRDSVMAIADA